MQRTLVLMQTQADDAAHRERRTALYSELARERVMGGLPKPMFANATKRLGIFSACSRSGTGPAPRRTGGAHRDCRRRGERGGF